MDQRLIIIGVATVALAAAVLVATVGGGDDGGDSAAGGGEISTDLSSKPNVPVPGGDPPTALQTNDVVVGDGPEAKTGDQVSMQYVGVTFDGGNEFDASWDRGQPFDFQLGAGNVIGGWDQGIPGMKVGGRRELIIPADLAYGAQGSPPDIPPDAALIFVVDLISIG